MNEDVIFIYNEIVTTLSVDAPDVPLADIREAMFQPVRDLLEDRDRDLDREARDLIEKVIIPERDRRSRSLKKDIEYVIEAVNDTDRAAFVAPMLAMAFPTGDPRGVDKLLSNWRAEDLQEMAMGRYRQAANAMKEAREMDDTAQHLVSLMRSHGAAVIGDLFGATDVAA